MCRVIRDTTTVFHCPSALFISKAQVRVDFALARASEMAGSAGRHDPYVQIQQIRDLTTDMQPPAACHNMQPMAACCETITEMDEVFKALADPAGDACSIA